MGKNTNRVKLFIQIISAVIPISIDNFHLHAKCLNKICN